MFNRKEMALIYNALELYQKSLATYQTETYEDVEDLLDKIAPSVKRYNENYECNH
tara:strand:+ start:603 stop:767 length:165 start_codon:yes stop_codon:yes gene_type:complete